MELERHPDAIGLNVHEFLIIKQLACNVAKRFGCPIYLVGSAITDEDPMDIDIIMVVNDKFYKRMIGCSNEALRSYVNMTKSRSFIRDAKFILKQKIYFDEHILDRDFDFKIQDRILFEHKDGPRLRLDLYDELF